MSVQRCAWCRMIHCIWPTMIMSGAKPVMMRAHLFEMLCSGRTAGRSVLITVLKKRDCLSATFLSIPDCQIAQFSDAELENNFQDAGLIRHIGKLKAIRDNAMAWQHLSQELKTTTDQCLQLVMELCSTSDPTQ